MFGKECGFLRGQKRPGIGVRILFQNAPLSDSGSEHSSFFYQQKCSAERNCSEISKVATWGINFLARDAFTQVLSLYTTETDASWRAVADRLNAEYRAGDRFATAGGITKTIVLPSWLIHLERHETHVIHVADAKLKVIGSAEHWVSHLDASGESFFVTPIHTWNPFSHVDFSLNKSTRFTYLFVELLHQTISESVSLGCFKTWFCLQVCNAWRSSSKADGTGSRLSRCN